MKKSGNVVIFITEAVTVLHVAGCFGEIRETMNYPPNRLAIVGVPYFITCLRE